MESELLGLSGGQLRVLKGLNPLHKLVTDEMEAVIRRLDVLHHQVYHLN
jgi:hypothetical protein